MSGVFLFAIMLMGASSLHTTPVQQRNFVGCFNRVSDGALQFGAVPSGELFTLRGHTNLAEEHVNQLVRVVGDVDQTGAANSTPAVLTVERVQPLAASCTSALPAKALAAVPGKVGEDAVAVPLTNTSTEDRTTPGFQTQAATVPSSDTQRFSKQAGSPAAPPSPEQFGQSEASANRVAKSAERTEIVPGKTLGVVGSGAQASGGGGGR